MKKLLKNSIFVAVFMLAFLFCGVSTISAASNAINNTKISGVATNYTVEENKYYVVNGSTEENSVRISNKDNGKTVGFTFVNYNATVAVVKCSELGSEEGTCKTWSMYNYNTNANTTMDALKKGLTLNFKADSFKEANDVTSVSGAELSQLNSVYGLNNTYFVIVQYKLTGLFDKTAYDPDIFRVVFTNDIAGISASSADGTTVKVTSGVPIDSYRYFHVANALESGYDFDTKYTDATNGVTQTLVNSESEFKDGAFHYTFTITKEDSDYYYAEIKDVAGRTVTLDVNNNSTTTDNTGSGGNNDSNVATTNVGKIILIALIVVLVLSLVLVIVQRIVDYKKKLY